jgi:DNA helicase-2/ATP-dependent DNA helicase PcrA
VDILAYLDTPHRWEHGAVELGQWILKARDGLAAGGQVDLRRPWPSGLNVLCADNVSPNSWGYQIASAQSGPVYRAARSADPLLVLAAYTKTTNAVHALFNRQFVLWEGHVRDSLPELVEAMQNHEGDAQRIGEAVVVFLENVATGFSRNSFGTRLLQEIKEGCSQTRRGKPARLQELGHIILKNPNHRGVSAFLAQLEHLQKHDRMFSSIYFDHRREFWEAMKVGEFDDAEMGLAEVNRRRSYAHLPIPRKAISTIHKAKGLQCKNILLMACDGKHFPDDAGARCKLYVAISRAQQSLTIVTSATAPSALIRL